MAKIIDDYIVYNITEVKDALKFGTIGKYPILWEFAHKKNGFGNVDSILNGRKLSNNKNVNALYFLISAHAADVQLPPYAILTSGSTYAHSTYHVNQNNKFDEFGLSAVAIVIDRFGNLKDAYTRYDKSPNRSITERNISKLIGMNFRTVCPPNDKVITEKDVLNMFDKFLEGYKNNPDDLFKDWKNCVEISPNSKKWHWFSLSETNDQWDYPLKLRIEGGVFLSKNLEVLPKHFPDGSLHGFFDLGGKEVAVVRNHYGGCFMIDDSGEIINKRHLSGIELPFDTDRNQDIKKHGLVLSYVHRGDKTNFIDSDGIMLNGDLYTEIFISSNYTRYFGDTGYVIVKRIDTKRGYAYEYNMLDYNGELLFDKWMNSIVWSSGRKNLTESKYAASYDFVVVKEINNGNARVYDIINKKYLFDEFNVYNIDLTVQFNHSNPTLPDGYAYDVMGYLLFRFDPQGNRYDNNGNPKP